MKQVTIKGFVYEKDYGHGTQKVYEVWPVESLSNQYNTLIGPTEFQYTIPEDFNPIAQKVAALQKEKERIGAEFAARVRQIDDEIGKLTAISYDEEVVQA